MQCGDIFFFLHLPLFLGSSAPSPSLPLLFLIITFLIVHQSANTQPFRSFPFFVHLSHQQRHPSPFHSLSLTHSITPSHLFVFHLSNSHSHPSSPLDITSTFVCHSPSRYQRHTSLVYPIVLVLLYSPPLSFATPFATSQVKQQTTTTDPLVSPYSPLGVLCMGTIAIGQPAAASTNIIDNNFKTDTETSNDSISGLNTHTNTSPLFLSPDRLIRRKNKARRNHTIPNTVACTLKHNSVKSPPFVCFLLFIACWHSTTSFLLRFASHSIVLQHPSPFEKRPNTLASSSTF